MRRAWYWSKHVVVRVYNKYNLVVFGQKLVKFLFYVTRICVLG